MALGFGFGVLSLTEEEEKRADEGKSKTTTEICKKKKTGFFLGGGGIFHGVAATSPRCSTTQFIFQA